MNESPPLPGNSRFPCGVGKTWEAGAFEKLLDDVAGRLFGVYGDDTTLGAERPHLQEWANGVGNPQTVAIAAISCQACCVSGSRIRSR